MDEPTVREILEEQMGVDVPETPVVENAVVETETQKADRVRDESGRFAKNESTPAEKVADKSIAQAAPETVIPELTPLQRPSSWKKELWPVWDKMAAGQALTPQESRQVAEYNNNREQQFASGVSTYKQEAERARSLLEVVAPYQEEMARYGVEAPTIVRNLLSAQRTLTSGSPQQKLNLWARVAQDHGIPLEAFFDQNARNQYLATPYQQPPQPQIDINQAVRAALEERDTFQTIQQMESNTEKYPFFPYVRNSMAQILEAGDATDLDEAYQRSLALPEHSLLSTVMQQQQSAAEEQQRIQVAQKTAKVARANNLSPKSATPAAVNGNGKTSVRDALVEAMTSHNAGGRV